MRSEILMSPCLTTDLNMRSSSYLKFVALVSFHLLGPLSLLSTPSAQSHESHDLLHPSASDESGQHKLNRIVQQPNSYFMVRIHTKLTQHQLKHESFNQFRYRMTRINLSSGWISKSETISMTKCSSCVMS